MEKILSVPRLKKTSVGFSGISARLLLCSSRLWGRAGIPSVVPGEGAGWGPILAWGAASSRLAAERCRILFLLFLLSFVEMKILFGFLLVGENELTEAFGNS